MDQRHCGKKWASLWVGTTNVTLGLPDIEDPGSLRGRPGTRLDLVANCRELIMKSTHLPKEQATIWYVCQSAVSRGFRQVGGPKGPRGYSRRYRTTLIDPVPKPMNVGVELLSDDVWALSCVEEGIEFLERRENRSEGYYAFLYAHVVDVRRSD